MRIRRWLVVAALCVIGMMLPGCQKQAVSPPAPAPVTVSAGERLFMEGVGHSGAVERTDANGAWVTLGGGCAACHGADGSGTDTVPPVDMNSLGMEHTIMHMSALEVAPSVVFVHGSAHATTPAAPMPAEPSATVSPAQPMEGPWTQAQVLEIVRTGVTPEGYKLSAQMPRWRLDDVDGAALMECLHGL